MLNVNDLVAKLVAEVNGDAKDKRAVVLALKQASVCVAHHLELARVEAAEEQAAEDAALGPNLISVEADAAVRAEQKRAAAAKHQRMTEAKEGKSEDGPQLEVVSTLG